MQDIPMGWRFLYQTFEGVSKWDFRTLIMRIKQNYTDILPGMPWTLNGILIRDNPFNPLNPCSFLLRYTLNLPTGCSYL